jgi:hypothetical protein
MAIPTIVKAVELHACLQTFAIFSCSSITVDESDWCAMESLDKSKVRDRVISSSYTQPGALPSNVNAEGLLQLLLSFRHYDPSVTPDLLNLASRADEIAFRDMESHHNLQRSTPGTSTLPPVGSIANGMLALEQQLASLNEELQRRRALPPDPSSLSGGALNVNNQLAFLTDQQQGRHQGLLQATHSVMDTIPTHERQLPSLTVEYRHRHSAYQARRSVPNRASFSTEEQLALLTEQQQGHCTSFQDRMPAIEQHVASLNVPASRSPASRLPSKLLAEQHQTSQVPSLEKLQLLAQLQRGIVPQAKAEIQAPAGSYPFGNDDQGNIVAMGPLHSGVPTESPIPPSPPYHVPHEQFPGKLYRLLAEVESNGNEHIISFTPDGCAFKIHSREAFIKHVSPAYFRQAKITSFVRQLNFYGFLKLLEGRNRGGFAHPYFLRGRPELLLKIERKEVAPRPKKCRGQIK